MKKINLTPYTVLAVGLGDGGSAGPIFVHKITHALVEWLLENSEP